jgi:nicotinamidase-related amidase
MAKTQPEPIRDPVTDHLLTPENCALVLIDYQPEQYRTITSTTKEEINLNVVALCKLARAYDIPVIVSTVAVDMGVNEGTDAEIMAELPGVPEIDRTGVNSWEMLISAPQSRRRAARISSWPVCGPKCA